MRMNCVMCLSVVLYSSVEEKVQTFEGSFVIATFECVINQPNLRMSVKLAISVQI